MNDTIKNNNTIEKRIDRLEKALARNIVGIQYLLGESTKEEPIDVEQILNNRIANLDFS